MFTLSQVLNNACRTMFAPNTEPTANDAAPAVSVRSIPMPVGKQALIPFGKIRRVHNVRVPEMEKINATRLLPSIKASGFLPAYPLMVEESDHGMYNLLAGHGRTAALRLMSDKERNEALKAFKGDVPAIVYKNLTPEGRAAIRAHDFTASSDKMRGDKWSDQLIVDDFIEANPKITDTEIATFMGWLSESGKNKGNPNRNRAMLHRRLHDLGIVEPTLLKEYQKRWDSMMPEKERTSPFVDSQIAELHALLAMQPSGEAVQSKVKEILTASPDAATDVAIVPHKFTPQDARDLIKTCADTRVRRLLLAVTGQGNGPGVPAESVNAVMADINVAFKAEKAPLEPTEVTKDTPKRGHAKTK